MIAIKTVLESTIVRKMKLLVVSLTLLFGAVNVAGQPNRPANPERGEMEAARLLFVSDRGEAKRLAEMDVAEGVPCLLLASGEYAVAHPGDIQFASQYQVCYFDFACISPPDEVMIAYNQEVFAYLEERHGQAWRKSVRKDVVGFKGWRKLK